MQAPLPSTIEEAPTNRDLPPLEYNNYVAATFERVLVIGDGHCMYSAFLASLGIFALFPRNERSSIGEKLRAELAAKLEDLRGLNPQPQFQDELRNIGPSLSTNEFASMEHIFFLARLFRISVTINSVISKTSKVISINLNLPDASARVHLECDLVMHHYAGLRPWNAPVLTYTGATDGSTSLLDVITSWIAHRNRFPPRGLPYSVTDLATHAPVVFNAQLLPIYAELSLADILDGVGVAAATLPEPPASIIHAQAPSDVPRTTLPLRQAQPLTVANSSSATRLVPVHDEAGSITHYVTVPTVTSFANQLPLPISLTGEMVSHTPSSVASSTPGRLNGSFRRDTSLIPFSTLPQIQEVSSSLDSVVRRSASTLRETQEDSSFLDSVARRVAPSSSMFPLPSQGLGFSEPATSSALRGTHNPQVLDPTAGRHSAQNPAATADQSLAPPANWDSPRSHQIPSTANLPVTDHDGFATDILSPAATRQPVSSSGPRMISTQTPSRVQVLDVDHIDMQSPKDSDIALLPPSLHASSEESGYLRLGTTSDLQALARNQRSSSILNVPTPPHSYDGPGNKGDVPTHGRVATQIPTPLSIQGGPSVHVMSASNHALPTAHVADMNRVILPQASLPTFGNASAGVVMNSNLVPPTWDLLTPEAYNTFQAAYAQFRRLGGLTPFYSCIDPCIHYSLESLLINNGVLPESMELATFCSQPDAWSRIHAVFQRHLEDTDGQTTSGPITLAPVQPWDYTDPWGIYTQALFKQRTTAGWSDDVMFENVFAGCRQNYSKRIVKKWRKEVLKAAGPNATSAQLLRAQSRYLSSVFDKLLITANEVRSMRADPKSNNTDVAASSSSPPPPDVRNNTPERHHHREQRSSGSKRRGMKRLRQREDKENSGSTDKPKSDQKDRKPNDKKAKTSTDAAAKQKKPNSANSLTTSAST